VAAAAGLARVESDKSGLTRESEAESAIGLLCKPTPQVAELGRRRRPHRRHRRPDPAFRENGIGGAVAAKVRRSWRSACCASRPRRSLSSAGVADPRVNPLLSPYPREARRRCICRRRPIRSSNDQIRLVLPRVLALRRVAAARRAGSCPRWRPRRRRFCFCEMPDRGDAGRAQRPAGSACTTGRSPTPPHFPRATALRGFHRLAVNHSGRRTGLSTSRLARRHDESVVERGKGSVARPRVEIPLHRGVGWKILRQLSPLATGGRNVEDRVHHRSHVCFARTPEG
jgi:hypothetical protein